jgi:phosphatidate cytidylyltransferase
MTGRDSLHLDLGFVHAEGRALFLFLLTVVVLGAAGLAVLLSGDRELRRRWLTWSLIAPVVGLTIWAGRAPTAVLAGLLGLQAVREYARLVGLPAPERRLLLGAAVVVPAIAWAEPGWLALTPLALLAGAVPALVVGDADGGLRRAGLTGFGLVWIPWALAHLVLAWDDAYLLCFAAAAVDVGAWCGGRGLRRFGWARRPLSPLSPSKTVGGVAGSVVAAAVVLTVLGSVSVGLVVAVAFGALAGDLLESMVKRQAGVKDAGRWLPGFGGLLDRVDSLLVVLPLAAVLR